MNDEWVPIILFMSIGAIALGNLYFKGQAKRDAHQTLRAAIERGDALTPDLIEAMGRETPTPVNDFRRGILLIFLGIGISVFGYFVDPGDTELLGIASIPGLLGVGYLFIWKFAPRD